MASSISLSLISLIFAIVLRYLTKFLEKSVLSLSIIAISGMVSLKLVDVSLLFELIVPNTKSIMVKPMMVPLYFFIIFQKVLNTIIFLPP